MSLQDFYKQFKNHVALLDEVDEIFVDDSLVGQVAMMNGGVLLHNIHPAGTPLDIHCNSSSTTTNMEGDLAGYGTVWYPDTAPLLLEP